MIHEHVHNKGAFNIQELVKEVKRSESFVKAGALAIFIGVVRGETLEGEKVQRLEIEAYEEKANEVLSGICSDLKKREGIVDVQIHHFVGNFNVGEDLVYVLVAGSHRENVFPVLAEAVERYKKEAPLFKKEFIIGENGQVRGAWVAEKER
ncbi:MAG: molybdenum cofactor biosynthesis protein MoaE [Candidatus Bathyarchaeia archaeon]